ncbi:seipin-like isoform X2 [Lineus longissimus]|uniref:seipin-like isoform X2 n=1 Tax=Lineus longissimus TaxID=88925 RepID=UPI00315C9D26
MILSWISAAVNWLQRSTSQWLTKIKSTLLKVIVVLTYLAVLLWISIFFYGSFYYLYMPAISHVKPVHLQFKGNCDITTEGCGFPSANFSLVSHGKEQLMLRGQPYRIQLELEMPESPVNQMLGMFMVRLDFLTHFGRVVQSTNRAGVLHYKSPLLQTLDTLVYSPFLLFGSREQKQLINVELFNNYLEDAYKPSIGAYIEIQARRIEIYSSVLKIYANFTGLRYLMFYHPVLCAICGVSSNMVFLTAVALLSWYRFLSDKMPRQSNPSRGDSSRPSLEERRANIRAALKREQRTSNDQVEPSGSAEVPTGMLPYGAEQEPVIIDTSKKRVKKTFTSDPDRSIGWPGDTLNWHREPETLQSIDGSASRKSQLEEDVLNDTETLLPSGSDTNSPEDMQLRRRGDVSGKSVAS